MTSVPARREMNALALLDALDRLTLTRLGSVTEARIQGHDGTEYRTRIQGESSACSCPAAIYASDRHSLRSKPCKHVSALRLVRQALPSTLGGGQPS